MQNNKNKVLPQNRVLLASSIGNFIEWYEFTVYAFLTTILAQTFFHFPGQKPLTAVILTYASFALSFFIRPLGAILFGYMGDKLGRKPMLILVLSIMTLATTAIGLVPSYAKIGFAAPLIVTGLRILQGLFASGEYGGAVAMMTEFAPPNKRGFFGAWQSLTVAIGLLTGVGVVVIVSTVLTPEQMLSWGWRMPFFLAFPMGLIAFWLRFHIKETPLFIQQEKNRRAKSAKKAVKPKVTVGSILMGATRIMAWSAAGYAYLVVMPTYLQTALHTTFNQALIITLIANIGFAVTIIPAGIISDKIGRRAVMILGSAILFVLSIPLLHLLQAKDTTLMTEIILLLIAGGAVGLLAGAGPAMLAETFPTSIRCRGLGLAYGVSNAVFGGSAGLIITALTKESGNLDILAWYVMVTALVSIVALMTLNKSDHLRPLDER